MEQGFGYLVPASSTNLSTCALDNFAAQVILWPVFVIFPLCTKNRHGLGSRMNKGFFHLVRACSTNLSTFILNKSRPVNIFVWQAPKPGF
jgi:hypothetical protein